MFSKFCERQKLKDEMKIGKFLVSAGMKVCTVENLVFGFLICFGSELRLSVTYPRGF